MSKRRSSLRRSGRSDPRRPTQVALAVASLVAGLLALINLDRNLHQKSAAQLGFNASQHGWPMVFLERQFADELPNHVRASRSYDWPWPPVEGESRRWNFPGLAADLGMGLMIVGTTFLFTRRVMWQLEPRSADQ